MRTKIIILSYKSREYTVKIFPGIETKELKEHVRYLLKLSRWTPLFFYDEMGANVFLGGNIRDGTRLFASTYPKQ